MQGVVQTDDVSNRCVQLIHECCGVLIRQLQVTFLQGQVQITGVIGSWHGKQLASEAARKLFPDRRISNQLRVIKTH